MFKDLVIDRKSGKPVSEQIVSFLRSRIHQGELAPGDKLPTTQELMESFGVGTTTIRQAIAALKEEGLVKPTPRLGTIVRALEPGQELRSSINGRVKSRTIAVVGLIDSPNGSERFRPETAGGVITECNRLNVQVLMLPNDVLAESSAALYERLAQFNCEGFIFCGDTMSDDKIDYLIARGICVITARRFRHKDGRACIESDFEGAGYDVGLYYYSLNHDKVTIFSHFKLTCDVHEAQHLGHPLGVKQGIVRAYESKGLTPDIDWFVNFDETSQATKNIMGELEALEDRTGLLFTNGYQFLNLFKEFSFEAHRLLQDKKITVISNKTINLELEEYVKDLDFMVLIDPYEQIGRQMVGKLVGIIEGYLPTNSTTLADIKFTSFKDAIRKG